MYFQKPLGIYIQYYIQYLDNTVHFEEGKNIPFNYVIFPYFRQDH